MYTSEGINTIYTEKKLNKELR